MRKNIDIFEFHGSTAGDVYRRYDENFSILNNPFRRVRIPVRFHKESNGYLFYKQISKLLKLT